MNLMVLEDDPDLRRVVTWRFRTDGYRVDEVDTLHDARAALATHRYDCLVLDRLVPDGDAIDLVAELHDTPERAPMLVLSGLGHTDRRVEGLTLGADDYLCKPVRLEELVLRVQNLCDLPDRRTLAPLRIGPVSIDRIRGLVRIGDEPVHLTPRQYAVLAYLVVNGHRLVTTEELLDHCWDDQRDMFANPLRSQVFRLRRLFRGVLHLESVRGSGYVLRAASPAPSRRSGNHGSCN